MRRIPIALLVLATTGLGGFYAWARIRAELPARPAWNDFEADYPPISTPVIQGPTTHLVTPEMAAASGEMLGREAPPFRVAATDGRPRALADLLAEGPVLLTFIKDGCPCSEAAQRYFNALHTAYPEAAVLGVIDVEAEPARRWAERFRVSYPLLLDPAMDLVRGFGAENSAYVVLVDPRGRIDRHWPGFSGPMLRELGAALATMTGAPEQPLDLADAPDELYSGCPYEL